MPIRPASQPQDRWPAPLGRLKEDLQDFEGFYSILTKAHPGRSLARLEDFTARDLDTYQQALEGQGSPYKARPMSSRTVKTHLSHLLSVFGAAKKILRRWRP